MIIALTGKKRSGKDTVAEYLALEYGFTRLAFADAVKEMLTAINPWIDSKLDHSGIEGSLQTGVTHERLSTVLERVGGMEVAKDAYPEVRRLLQRIGTEAVRDIVGPNTWVDIVARKAASVDNAVISDCRFVNEADWANSEDGIVIKIIRDTGLSDSHASETGVDAILGDYIVENNDTLTALYRKIDRIMEGL